MALRTILLSLAAGVFLSFVGAFDTAHAPVVERTLMFVALGLGCAVAVVGGYVATGKIKALPTRPLLRRVVVVCIAGPACGVIAWLAIELRYLGHARLADLPLFLAEALLMGAVMTLLSWAIFRPRRAEAPAPPPAPPRFLDRLPVRLRGAEIYAVEAEDHYLRLHTSKGQDLILMRLADAIAELEGIVGAQTHRSWWVARDALADARRGDGRAVLKLKNGQEAPVSRSYAKALRDAGWF